MHNLDGIQIVDMPYICVYVDINLAGIGGSKAYTLTVKADLFEPLLRGLVGRGSKEE
jgi:hypothetical protein